MTLRRSALALAGLLLLTPLVLAAIGYVRERDEAARWVREAATAHERVSYAGEISSRRMRWAPSIGVRHDAGTGATAYSWSSYEVVRPAPTARMGADPAAWCLDVDAMAANYRAHSIGLARFLGRPARVLELRPRFEGRPRVRLTIDAATGLPLEVTTFRPDGALYRRSAFREIETAPQQVPAPRRGRLEAFRGVSVPLDRLQERIDFRHVRPDWIPEGFVLVDCRLSERLWHRVRLVYSDGVTVFELLQHPVQTRAQMETELLTRMGPEEAHRTLNRHARRRLDDLAEREPVGDDSVAAVYRHESEFHATYRLRADGVEVRLVARADLAEEEILHVLRSLRAR